MTKMRIDEALFELGNIIGHEKLIIDNANKPASIEGVIGSIVDAVGGANGLINDVPEKDYAISEDGITEIKSDGFLEAIPLYRVFSGRVRGEYFSGEWLDGSEMEGYAIYAVTEGEITAFGKFSETGKVSDAVECGDLCASSSEKSFTRIEN